MNPMPPIAIAVAVIVGIVALVLLTATPPTCQTLWDSDFTGLQHRDGVVYRCWHGNLLAVRWPRDAPAR